MFIAQTNDKWEGVLISAYIQLSKQNTTRQNLGVIDFSNNCSMKFFFQFLYAIKCKKIYSNISRPGKNIAHKYIHYFTILIIKI